MRKCKKETATAKQLEASTKTEKPKPRNRAFEQVNFIANLCKLYELAAKIEGSDSFEAALNFAAGKFDEYLTQITEILAKILG